MTTHPKKSLRSSKIPLKKSDIGFDTLPASERQALLDGGTTRVVKKNQILIREGTTADSIFVLLQGSAVTTKTDLNGHTIQLSLMTGGSIFGEVAMLTGSNRTATVTCLTAAKVLEIEKKILISAPEKFPALWMTLATILAHRLDKTTQKVTHLAFSTVLDRLKKICTEHQKDQKRQPLPSHIILAEMTGTSREVVSRNLKKLVIERILEKKGRKYYVR